MSMVRGGPIKALWLLCSFSCLLLFAQTRAFSHSLDALRAVFDGGPVPRELLESTRELEATAGHKTTREAAHAEQHRLLEEYLRAGLERRCTEAFADVSQLDHAIVRFRDEGQAEEEQAMRQDREEKEAFLKTNCAGTSIMNRPAVPRP
ncbi:MAG: hypothetical protein R3B37_10600 [Nitrospira sp.]|nr:hypothetical protein [Nitrospira sp.]